VDALNRRRFLQGTLALAGLGLLSGCGVPLRPSASPARIPKVGWLEAGTPASSEPNLEAFRRGLRELGYVEGQNIGIELRYADGREERLPELTNELVRDQVDVILTSAAGAVRAAMQATTTLPIIFTSVQDPVGQGFVASLARPGGNVTGLATGAGQETHGKRLQLLKEALPSMSRVAVLWTRNQDPNFLRQTESAAQALGVQVLSLELRSPDDLDATIASAATGRADALLVLPDITLVAHAMEITDLATRNRLPAMYPSSPYALAGGLLTYAANLVENYRRAATYLDKILKGAKPADLPVEQPMTFDFLINLKTAQALGLTIPQSVLMQATEVIQ